MDLMLEREDAYVLAVEVGEGAAAAVVDEQGRMPGIAEQAVDRSRPPNEVLALAVEAARDAIGRAGIGAVRAIGLTVPGTLRPAEGLCLFSPLLGWENIRVTAPFEEAFGVPVRLLDTLQAMFEGERWFGAGRDIDNFVCVRLGREIGGAIVIHRELYSGDSDSAGEIGHLTIDPDGPACPCGNQGCLETMASAPAIARMATESLRLGAQSILTEWVEDGQVSHADLVLRAARDGDALAIKIWEKVGRYLGLGLAACITLVNPRRIIVGGRMACAFDFFAPTMREEIRRRARMVPRDFTEVVQSPLGSRASLSGCGAAALQHVGVKPGPRPAPVPE